MTYPALKWCIITFRKDTAQGDNQADATEERSCRDATTVPGSDLGYAIVAIRLYQRCIPATN